MELQSTKSVAKSIVKHSFIKISSTVSKLMFIALLICFTNSVKANNVSINSPVVNGDGTLSFSISWDNSWNTTAGPANWDAVWVFVKRQSCTDNLWNHSLLSTSNVHTVSGGILQVDPASDGMGVYVRRSTTGNGNISASTVTLTLQTAATTIDNFQVLGIEMVSVPQGDFIIGDGTGGANGWNFRTITITSAMQTAGLGAASNYQSSSYGSTSSLPAAFPIGWNNFYCMKYEVSQDQYVGFLNSLTFNQQVSRTAASPASVAGTMVMGGANRNRIGIVTTGVSNTQPAVYGCDLSANGVFGEANDGQNIACNFLAWSDLIAYLDWAGMRPMTEFEFEKTCRGAGITQLANEYVWGTATITLTESGSISSGGTASELSTISGAGLCAIGVNNGTKGPLRCGYAATGSTTRSQAGSSYYGAMDMAGNVEEQCVGGYNTNYSAFTTTNGDGSLTSAGVANTTGWPLIGGGQTGGAIMRGGDWFTLVGGHYIARTSDRAWMTNNSNSGRIKEAGGRGVRSF